MIRRWVRSHRLVGRRVWPDFRGLIRTAAAVGLLSGAACNERLTIFAPAPAVGPGQIGVGSASSEDAAVAVPVFTLPDGGAGSDGPACVPNVVSCTAGAFNYCGLVGNGCGAVADCGACPAGQLCGGGGIPGLCGLGPGCQPVSCDFPGGRFCGKIGDGCGGTLDCAGCPGPGQVCGGSIPNVCGGGVGCVATTCDSAGGRFCDRIGDGCGGLLDCGPCTGAGEVCGGRGTPNVCSSGPDCVARTCESAGGRVCGTVGDACGGVLSCEPCPGGAVCGGAGIAGLCAAAAGCVPVDCQQPTGKYCGPIGDGCGGIANCQGCSGSDSCGGAGIPGVCGNPANGCTNLCLRQVMSCPGQSATVVTGRVVAPTPARFGAPDPIYNALVYVPNAPVEPFRKGVICDACSGAEASGSPLVQATTGPDGRFRLENVPAGENVPLVVQLGRWRRQVVIPRVEPCQTLNLDQELTRLPRNKREGNIPLMALSTGRKDHLECLLRKIGIDEAEFSAPTGNGRVHLYQTPNQPGHLAPDGTGTPESVLTSSVANLARYDMTIFACGGILPTAPSPDQGRLVEYGNMGGRVFLTHYGYRFAYQNPAWQQTAVWNTGLADPPNPLTGTLDQSFAKGRDFARWLEIVGAQAAPGQVLINAPQHSLDAVNPPALRWIFSTTPQTVQQFTFDTPVDARPASQCGRVLFSDFHVNPQEDFGNLPAFPGLCSNDPLTAQERVLEFMLFDLASCAQPSRPTPPPPPPAPPIAPPVAPRPPPVRPPAAPAIPPVAPPPPPIVP
jgi:hypothetical protein